MKNCTSNRFDIERFFIGELDKDPLRLKAPETVNHVLHICELRRERNEFLADHPSLPFILKKQKHLLAEVSKPCTRPVLVPVYAFACNCCYSGC